MQTGFVSSLLEAMCCCYFICTDPFLLGFGHISSGMVSCNNVYNVYAGC